FCPATNGITTPRIATRSPASANGGLPWAGCPARVMWAATGGAGGGVEGGVEIISSILRGTDDGAWRDGVRASAQAKGASEGACAGTGDSGEGGRVITPTLRSVTPSSPITASAHTISSGICHPQPSRTPNASELFSEWAAIHGYSEPLRW